MDSRSVVNFMKQQGFPEEAAPACGAHFAGLNFQPRVIAALAVIGILLQSPVLFFSLSALAWLSALAPALNPFEAFYNRVIAAPRGKPSLGPAPAPRRFAQGMAAAFMLIIAVALLNGWAVTAYVFEALFVVAISALLFGKLCLGSYVYHMLRGELSFANATLPWSHSR
jgi:Domain of unknown function (DUF4395)